MQSPDYTVREWQERSKRRPPLCVWYEFLPGSLPLFCSMFMHVQFVSNDCTCAGCVGMQGFMIKEVAAQKALSRHVDTKSLLKYLPSSIFTALASGLCVTTVNRLLSNITTSHSSSQKLFFLFCSCCLWTLLLMHKAAHVHSCCIQTELWSDTVCVSCDLWLRQRRYDQSVSHLQFLLNPPQMRNMCLYMWVWGLRRVSCALTLNDRLEIVDWQRVSLHFIVTLLVS